MSIPKQLDWYENDERLIPGHYHISNLVDILLKRGFSSHQILKRTKLFYDDILTGHSLITPQQYCQIIQNAQDLYNHPELSFLWGHGLFPGHYDGLSLLISHAETLDELISIFCHYHRLTPLMVLNRWEDEDTVYLEWHDEIGLGAHHRFMVEAYTIAITSLINWYLGEKLPWRFGFTTSKPSYVEEYDVNFGGRIQFDLGMDLIMLDRKLLSRTLPMENRKAGSKAAFLIAKKQCDEEKLRERSGFIHAVFQQQMSNMPLVYSLDEMSTLLSMSPSTFKRKLSKHHFNFQRIQDKARFSVSLKLIQKDGLTNNDLAEYLEIKDVNNFRRAFKRWCGLTPAAIKERLA